MITLRWSALVGLVVAGALPDQGTPGRRQSTNAWVPAAMGPLIHSQ